MSSFEPITIQKVFDTAIHLMDEQNESTGVTVTQDTTEYKYRTINILNTLIQILYSYSVTYDAAADGRPFPTLLTVTDYRNPDFTQVIPLDPAMAIGVLPYGLARDLILPESEELSRYFDARWSFALADLRSKQAAEFEPIPMPYGSI